LLRQGLQGRFARNTLESRIALSRLVSAITGRPLTVLSIVADEDNLSAVLVFSVK
jgi:hypothetical protein